MRYTVIDLADNQEAVSGLTLAEAFTRQLTLAGYNYSFQRFGGALHLNTRPERVDGRHLMTVNHSDLDGRQAIMAEAIGLLWGKYRVVTDDRFAALQGRGALISAPERARRAIASAR